MKLEIETQRISHGQSLASRPSSESWVEKGNGQDPATANGLSNAKRPKSGWREQRLSAWLRKVRHEPIAKQHTELCAKVRGHVQYYGIRGNRDALISFVLGPDCSGRNG